MTSFEEIAHLEVEFQAQVGPLPADLRVEWRIPQLCLALTACHGGKAAWAQLHVLSWAMRSQRNMDWVADVVGGRIPSSNLVVRYEPALTRVLDLMVGFGFAEWQSGRVLAPTVKAIKVVQFIQQEDAFEKERKFLSCIGKLTQSRATELLGRKSI